MHTFILFFPVFFILTFSPTTHSPTHLSLTSSSIVLSFWSMRRVSWVERLELNLRTLAVNAMVQTSSCALAGAVILGLGCELSLVGVLVMWRVRLSRGKLPKRCSVDGDYCNSWARVGCFARSRD